MNALEEMRLKLMRKYTKPRFPRLRVTADDSPRLPQSNIRNDRIKNEMPGRPPGRREK